MPLYSYHCDACGPFTDWQPMTRSDQMVACPSCSAQSQRQLAAPSLSAVSAHNRIAHERNERSTEAPRVVQRAELGSHGGYGHHHPPRQGRNMYRPTMLGHAH
jgi:putative FmdB family regulatory protein